MHGVDWIRGYAGRYQGCRGIYQHDVAAGSPLAFEDRLGDFAIQCSIAARQVRKKSDVVDALREMIAHDGPYLLEFMVPYQEHVLPMIPAGGTYRDIIKS